MVGNIIADYHWGDPPDCEYCDCPIRRDCTYSIWDCPILNCDDDDDDDDC